MYVAIRLLQIYNHHHKAMPSDIPVSGPGWVQNWIAGGP